MSKTYKIIRLGLETLAIGAIAWYVSALITSPPHTSMKTELLPAQIQTGRTPLSLARNAQALQLAFKYWHGTRCADGIKIQRGPLYPLQIIAQAGWSVSSDASSHYLDCTVTVNSLRHLITYKYYCGMMTHEIGHLAGFHERNGPDGGVHSRNPYNVMYPQLTSRSIPHFCT